MQTHQKLVELPIIQDDIVDAGNETQGKQNDKGSHGLKSSSCVCLAYS